MGMIEDMIGAMSGGKGATQPWLAQAMRGLLGTGEHPGIGLPELLRRLQQQGCEREVRSWLGHGPLLPLPAQRLHAALGDDLLREMASTARLTPEELVGKLSEHLPGVIARLRQDGPPHDNASR